MKRNTTIIPGCLLLFTLSGLLINCNSNNEQGNNIEKKDSLALKIERGNYLANHVANCLDCHSQRDFNYFSGPPKPGTEGMGGFTFDEKEGVPGVIHARNITPDTATGIGNWTDDEIARAMTQGISKNGDTLFPLMPYSHYNQMSRDDIYSIIAYIRTLKPINNKVQTRKLMIPMSMAYPPFLKPSIDSNKIPDVSDMAKYGGYIVNAAACMDCHTAMEKGQFNMSKMFAGGFLFDMGKFKVNTANITPDSATGIGAWTQEMFLAKFQTRREHAAIYTDPGKNNSIMPWAMFAGMDDFDIKSIYAYLRTVKPVSNKVEKYPK